MFRSSLIYLSKAEWAKNLMTNWDLAWSAASRFVAGEDVNEAISVVEDLNSKNIFATLDHLGEHTTRMAEADKAADDILDLLRAIESASVSSGVSIKLTQIGLSLDKELCKHNLCRILEVARDANNFVRIDMEDSPWVDDTLDLCREMVVQNKFTNTGVVIQSYLYRSEEDIKQLLRQGVRIRMCKGAYKEPGHIAYPKKQDVDKNFDHLVNMIVDEIADPGHNPVKNNGKFPPILAVASHDPDRIIHAKNYSSEKGVPKKFIEFQMLYGIRRDLQNSLVSEGYPVRVYVPFGTEWYPYYVRRLAERPANLYFFISNYFRN